MGDNKRIEPQFVREATPLKGQNGKITGYVCLMSDHSEWVCDEKGKNWQPNTFSLDELTVLFQKEQKIIRKAK